jgi:hypothetical protein
MPSYAATERAPPRQKFGEGGAAHYQVEIAARQSAPARNALDTSLNRSPRSQSLAQLRATLDESPRVQSQLALQRALNRRGATQAGAPQAAKRKKPAPLQKKPNATGLPDQLKAGVENLSGLAMDDVRVHYSSQKPATVQAQAYAQGTEIHIAPGQEKHLPHEAWHVVQQKQGRVKPTLQAKGVAINDDAGLEAEADSLGRKASHAPLDAAGKTLVGAHRRETISRPVMQGFWPLVAAGLVGAAAYAFRRPLGNLARNAYHGFGRDRMVDELLGEAQETENLPNVNMTQTPALISGMTHNAGQYQVNVNPAIPITANNMVDRNAPFPYDPDTLHTARLHELTHVAVAEGYGGRNLPDRSTPLNMIGPESIAQHQALNARTAQLEQVYHRDPVIATLPRMQQQFILSRLQYMQGLKHIEFDSVVNELVYYFQIKGIPARSPLSQALVAAARERKDLRDT